MVFTFLYHQWKEFWRSRNKGGSIAAQLILGLFMLYLLLIAVVAGFSMAPLIHKLFPGKDQVVIFNGFILYYFLVDLAVRIQMQELPTLSIVPYLHLRIRKSQLVSFLNMKSLFSFYNCLPLFIFLPFSISHIWTTSGGIVSGAYVVSILSLVLFNNFLILYVKRRAINNIFYFVTILISVMALAALDYFKLISISAFSHQVFQLITQLPLLSIVFVLFALLIFVVNSLYLQRNLYTEELSSRSESKVSTDYAFLNRFGKVGELAALELKLILRHKRSRTTLIMSLLLLAYGFIFYRGPLVANNEFGKLMFAAVFMTGIGIINYGQFMFAWQSAHFDGILANKIDFTQFIKAKFLLFTIGSTILTILSSFYVVISYKLLLLHFVAYLYNIGIASVITLYFANFNYKRLDITKSASFNWQGVGATQWILGLPFLLTPLLLYAPFGISNQPYLGLAVVGGLGAISLLMRNFWIGLLVKKFEKQRYQIAEGFRE